MEPDPCQIDPEMDQSDDAKSALKSGFYYRVNSIGLVTMVWVRILVMTLESLKEHVALDRTSWYIKSFLIVFYKIHMVGKIL